MTRPPQSVAPLRAISLAIRLIPLPVLGLALSHCVIAIRRRHPEILERMGPHATANILIDPIDMPLTILLQPSRTHPASVMRLSKRCKWDARVSGPIGALFAMVQGSLDGDALFFSRKIKIEGNADAILALRNAIDATEIDLLTEISAHFGPLEPWIENALRNVLAAVAQTKGMRMRQAVRGQP